MGTLRRMYSGHTTPVRAILLLPGGQLVSLTSDVIFVWDYVTSSIIKVQSVYECSQVCAAVVLKTSFFFPFFFPLSLFFVFVSALNMHNRFVVWYTNRRRFRWVWILWRQRCLQLQRRR